jgi:transposase
MGKKNLTFPQKMRLVNLALSQGPEAAAREMGVNPSTAYKWLKRYEEGGTQNLKSRPRGKPREKKVTQEVEARLLDLHQENPARSGAKVARLYAEEGGLKLHRNTVLAVLKKGVQS